MSPTSCTAARRALYNAFIKPALAAEPGPFLPFLLPREQYRLQSSSSYAWTPLEKSSRPFNDERSRDRQSQTQYTPFGGPRRNDDRAQSDYGDGAGSDRGVRIRRTGSPKKLRVPLPPMDTRIYKTPWDQEIKEPFIAFKNRDDELEPYVNTRAILEEVDPQKEHLITIGTIPHPRNPSEKILLCKIFTKETLREMGRTATARLKEQKKAQGSAKNLEFNWAAGSADLDRQLGQMVKFLGEGRRVDVLLARKKGSRKAEIEESRALLIKVRAAAAGCGAKEVSKADGEAGKRMTMAFKKTGGGGGTATKDDSDSAASMSEDDAGTQDGPDIKFGLAKK